MANGSESGWHFPPPVTPAVRQVLAIHPDFMLALTLLFAAIFAVMLVALIRHRRPRYPAARPGGVPDWLWSLVPFAIVLALNFALHDPAAAF